MLLAIAGSVPCRQRTCDDSAGKSVEEKPGGPGRVRAADERAAGGSGGLDGDGAQAGTDRLSEAAGHTGIDATGKPISDPAQSKTLRMRGNSLHGNREIPASSIRWVDRLEKAASRTSRMHEVGKSDNLVLPGKRANKGRRPAESVEGRGSAKGNERRGATPRTQSRRRGAFRPRPRQPSG
jgi:hypothetical protein